MSQQAAFDRYIPHSSRKILSTRLDDAQQDLNLIEITRVVFTLEELPRELPGCGCEPCKPCDPLHQLSPRITSPRFGHDKLSANGQRQTGSSKLDSATTSRETDRSWVMSFNKLSPAIWQLVFSGDIRGTKQSRRCYSKCGRSIRASIPHPHRTHIHGHFSLFETRQVQTSS